MLRNLMETQTRTLLSITNLFRQSGHVMFVFGQWHGMVPYPWGWSSMVVKVLEIRNKTFGNIQNCIGKTSFHFRDIIWKLWRSWTADEVLCHSCFLHRLACLSMSSCTWERLHASTQDTDGPSAPLFSMFSSLPIISRSVTTTHKSTSVL